MAARTAALKNVQDSEGRKDNHSAQSEREMADFFRFTVGMSVILLIM